jgi:hypothetical protein
VFARKWVVAPFLTLPLLGCGLTVPEIQENPLASDSEKVNFVVAISQHVRCEVQDAVLRLYAENAKADPLNRNLAWFDNWAVQYTLTLTTDEKGSLSPNTNWTPVSPPTRIFNLSLGATLSSEGQRINKIGAFYTIAELKKFKACPPQNRFDGAFIQGDLKIYQWLLDSMVAIGIGDFPAPANQNGPLKTNVLSQEVKFDVVTTGTVTPGWKFATGTINQTGTFLSASRDRTQDLSVTFGPADPTWAGTEVDPVTKKVKIDPKTGKPVMRSAGLAPAAADADLSAAIATGVENGIRNALRSN